MEDLIIYICLTIAFVTLLCLRARSLHGARSCRTAKDHSAPSPYDEPVQDDLDPESQTRSLIGDDAYTEMSRHVDELLTTHMGDHCVTVQLTSGSESDQAARVLHRLLPGDPLTLCRNVDCGVPMIDVYSNGYRIGRLLLGDADRVYEVMRYSHVTGVYVAEQNCYGDCNFVSMGIIVFHSPEEASDAVDEAIGEPSAYKVTFSVGDDSLVLYQN